MDRCLYGEGTVNSRHLQKMLNFVSNVEFFCVVNNFLQDFLFCGLSCLMLSLLSFSTPSTHPTPPSIPFTNP